MPDDTNTDYLALAKKAYALGRFDQALAAAMIAHAEAAWERVWQEADEEWENATIAGGPGLDALDGPDVVLDD